MHNCSNIKIFKENIIDRSGSRTAATSKMELFVIIVNDWKPLASITKSFIWNNSAVLGPSLIGT